MLGIWRILKQPRKVFVSGASGYIGGAIVRVLAASGFNVFAGARRPIILPDGVQPINTGDLSQPSIDLTAALTQVDAVVHAAGLGHKRGVAPDTWRRANVDAAVNLAQAAKSAGATRFVMISTAHVHGRVHDGLVRDDTPPNPMDDYAASKLQAERDVAAIFGAGLSLIRPVAVIGPGCPGNIPLLLKFLQAGVPLPFASIRNRRGFIQVDDLARLVLAVLRADMPPGTVLAAHPEAIGTPNLIRALAAGLDVNPRLLPCPPALLRSMAALLGQSAMWQSLAGNFVAEPAAALALAWQPAQTLAESLAKTSRYYNTTNPGA